MKSMLTYNNKQGIRLSGWKLVELSYTMIILSIVCSPT